MDFRFSDDQEALRSSVRDLLDREAGGPGGAYVRAMIDDDAGVTAALWAKISELGWPATLIPESAGGLGLGLVDLTVMLEEQGRLPLPGPFLSSAVFATLAARALELEDLLVPLAAGTQRGTIGLDEYGHGDPVDRVRTRAVRKGPHWLLRGTKPVVFDGHTADWALVVARTESGLGTFRVDQPHRFAELVPTTDVCRKVTVMSLDDVAGEPVGPPGDHSEIWRRVADDAAVAVCAELIGTAEESLHLAVAYAKVREQFGRPIATFQAIKHKAAEMLQRLELARVGTHFAAWASDVDDPQRAVAASMAKADVVEAAVHVTGESIQIHGGVGFTWDCDAHLYYRRAKAADLLLGGQGHHRHRVADLVLGPA